MSSRVEPLESAVRRFLATVTTDPSWMNPVFKPKTKVMQLLKQWTENPQIVCATNKSHTSNS